MELTNTLNQDLQAFVIAFEGEETRADLAVVFANRFLSNLLFLNKPSPYATIGFGLRLSSMDNLRARQIANTAKDPTEVRRLVKEATREWIVDIQERMASPEIDPVLVWRDLYKYVKSTRKVFLTSPEAAAYKDNELVTSGALSYLFDSFLLNDGEIAEPGTAVPDGCLNEIGRLVSVHGVSERDYPLVAIIFALSWLNEFVARYWTKSSVPAETVLAAKKRFSALLEPIRPLLQRDNFPNLEALAAPASTILSDILMTWRKDFIRFMDSAVITTKKGQPQVSKETREKLSESIKGAIEKDLFGKKGRSR